MKPLKKAVFAPPRLSDETVIQVHDFIHHVLDIFESCYGDQIDVFYEGLCDMASDDELDLGDPPF